MGRGVYTSRDPKIHISFNAYFERKDPDGYDDGGIWGYLTETLPNAQPVQGIGIEAYYSDINNAFIVRTAQDVLHAAGGLSREILQQLVKIIIDKV